MIIGVPKEIKAQECRVAVVPSGVLSFVDAGHTVYVEKNAGIASGFTNDEYTAAGAVILDTAAEVFTKAEMIMKVKEPLPSEYGFLRDGLILFTYLHLAPDDEQAKALLDARVTGIAYETVQLDNGTLPLLSPMSEIAGRMSIQIGANLLQKTNGGSGILTGGVPGVPPANITILGGGVAGSNAAKTAIGMGASVTILDTSYQKLAYLDDLYANRILTLMSNSYNIQKAVASSDLLVSAVLIPGARTAQLVTEEMVKSMRGGSVMIDISIDQGGAIATMDRMTSHENPFFVKHGILHYSVPNMPGAVPRTSTLALSNATMPYALQIANKGVVTALGDNPALAKGLNVYEGKVTNAAVAEAQGLEYHEVNF